jgi:polysaccharide biosynthesis protein PslH
MERWCEHIETVRVGGLFAAPGMVLGALSTQIPLQVLYYSSPALRRVVARTLCLQHYDLVHASLIRTAPYVWNIKPPVVLDLTDALSRSIAGRLPRLPALPRAVYAFEHRRVVCYEQDACRHFPQLLVCAQADATALNAKNVTVIRNAVDIARFPFSRDERENDLIVMTGNMGYHPNVDGAVWFVMDIWPALRRARPAARLYLVGARPAPAVRALQRLPGITVTGHVSDMHAYLRRATVAICPIRCGSGIQNKVLEAMSSGTPIVCTPHGNEGVGGLPGHELLIAQDATAFTQATIALLANPARREELAQAARARIEREFTWEQHGRRLEEIYAQAFSPDT